MTNIDHADRRLPGGWKLADHPKHGRVLVVRTDGENAIYATPYKATGIRTRACMASDLTFLGTEDQTMEEGMTTRIIRTLEELSALDPDTVLMTTDRVDPLTLARHWLDSEGNPARGTEIDLPAVVIATGDHVRSARQALEGPRCR